MRSDHCQSDRPAFRLEHLDLAAGDRNERLAAWPPMGAIPFAHHALNNLAVDLSRIIKR